MDQLYIHKRRWNRGVSLRYAPQSLFKVPLCKDIKGMHKIHDLEGLTTAVDQ